jgi:hypothetical protein
LSGIMVPECHAHIGHYSDMLMCGECIKINYFTMRTQDDLEGNREAVTGILRSTKQ